MVLSLSAKRLAHGGISAHMEEIYGAKVSKETVTRITDGVLEISEVARRLIAHEGYDPIYGARPLRRFIALMNSKPGSGAPSSAGDVQDGATIGVDVRDGQLDITYHNPPGGKQAAA